jgi:hypothetical protein
VQVLFCGRKINLVHNRKIQNLDDTQTRGTGFEKKNGSELDGALMIEKSS